MLFINKCYLSRFSGYRSMKEITGKEIQAVSTWSNSYADYNFPEIIKDDVWVSAMIHCQRGYYGRMALGVKLGNGMVGRLSYSQNCIMLPYSSGSNYSHYSPTIAFNFIEGKYNKVLFHAWIDKDDRNKLWFQMFINGKNIGNKPSISYYSRSDKPIDGFTYFRLGGAEDSSEMFFKNIIVSDKEITIGTQLAELPISSVNGWLTNEDGSFSATEFDTEGSLVPDAIGLAKLKDCNIQNSVLLGNYIRQGDNINNLHIKASDKEIDMALTNGINTPISQELGITNIDDLSSIIISPKG